MTGVDEGRDQRPVVHGGLHRPDHPPRVQRAGTQYPGAQSAHPRAGPRRGRLSRLRRQGRRPQQGAQDR